MNPLAKLRQEITFTAMSNKTIFTRQYLQNISSFSPKRMGRLPVNTVLRLEKDLDVKLIDYITK